MIQVGIDCIEVSRFNDFTNAKFIDRIFTENEKSYCLAKSLPEQHFAVRFAAKEAIIKAFFAHDIALNVSKIEILNDSSGVPFANILLPPYIDYNISISLTHTKEIAMAVALISAPKP